jgi:hypothetical protein
MAEESQPMIAILTCWLKGHDWHNHGSFFRYCRRCGVEQVWAMSMAAKPADRWRTHRGGM